MRQTTLSMRQTTQSLIDILQVNERSNELQLKGRVLNEYEQHVKNKLNCILSITKESKMNFVASLNELLKAIWSLTKGTMLCYTAIPEHSVTLFMCKAARFVAKENHCDSALLSPLSYLMPDMKELESNSESCSNLDHIALEELVKSHVLSEDGKYLLPASSLLSEQYASVDAKSNLVRNPYWDTTEFDSASAAYIFQTDLKKLERHSNLTMAVAETKRALCQMMNETSNLLGQLRELIRQLTLNDANHQGSEVDAGGGAYPAIIRFQVYYDSLTQRDKNSIPANLKHEIELLLRLACNKEENRDAVDTIETCIATRRNKLNIAMRGSDAILSQIGSSDQTRAARIKNGRLEYDNSLKSLRLALSEGGHYAGRDQLLITTKLLSDLDIRFSIESKSDLMKLISLSSDELKGFLCENKSLKSQVIDQLRNVDDFIEFSINLSHESVIVLLNQCGNLIVNNFINNVSLESLRKFSLWLSSLSLEKCSEVCQVLRKVIPNIINNYEKFNFIMKSLTVRKRAVVYDVMQQELHLLIKSARAFNQVLEFLTPQQRSVIFYGKKNSFLDSFNGVVSLEIFLSTCRLSNARRFSMKWKTSYLELSIVVIIFIMFLST